MKKSILFFFLILENFLFAQSPQGINYQAVARDASGTVLQNQALSVRLTVHMGGTSNPVYRESHNVSTNSFGLFTLKIGQPASVLLGTFSTINWGTSTYFLQVEVNPGGGFVNMGTTQFMSVPYALYAEKAGGATGSNGLNSLTVLTSEPAGANCVNGGSRIETGLDANNNNVLEAGEVSNTAYVCNGSAGSPGSPGAAGLNCWDLNGNGVGDAGEDTNGDSFYNALDCKGAQGLTGNTGVAGLNCWDLNGNGTGDAGEDKNGDTFYDALDCQGAPGLTGNTGAAGLNCWDLNGNGIGDAGEDKNGDSFYDALDCKGDSGAQGPMGPPGSLPPGTSTGNTTFWDGTQWKVDNNNIYNAGGNVGIGTSTPAAKLDVVGTLKVSGGSPGPGKLFTSDGTGIGNWRDIAVGTSGNIFNIVSTPTTHTFNLPTANGTNTGQLSNVDWASFNNKLTTVSTNTLTFTGNGTSGSVLDLTTTGVTSGTYGSATQSPSFTVDAKGRITAASNNTINGLLPTGTAGQTLRHNGTNWVANSNIYNDGTYVGIGTVPTTNKLEVLGDINISAGSVFKIGNTRALGFGSTTLYVGDQAGAANTGSFNTFIGYWAGRNNTSAGGQTFIGYQAGEATTTGTWNTYIGLQAGNLGTTATANTSIGYNSGQSNVSGNYNTTLGYQAGYNNTGSNNTYIGYNAYGTAGLTNATAIGANASVTASNSLILGNGVNVGIGTTAPTAQLEVTSGSIAVQANSSSSTLSALYANNTGGGASARFWNGDVIVNNGRLGINTNTPTEKLEVQGKIKIVDATEGTGKVLTSDATGVASWQTTAALNIVSGTGTTTRVAFWNSANTLSSNADLYWDNTNNRLGLGTTAPNARFHLHAVSGAGSMRLTSASTGTTTGDGFSFTNDGTTNFYMTQHENADWYFGTASGATAMTIKPNASIGIGTISPSTSTKVHISGGGLGFDNNQGIWWNNSGGIMSSVMYVDNTNKLKLRGLGNGVGFMDSGGTENVTIDNFGNVGIGTVSPGYKFHTLMNSGYIAVEATASGSTPYGMRFISPDRNWYFLLSGGGTGAGSFGIYDGTASAYRFYIDPATGNTGFGTTSPGKKLTVQNSSYGISHTDGTASVSTYIGNTYSGAGNIAGGSIGTETDHPFFIYVNNSGEKLYIGNSLQNYNVGIGTATPAEKLHVAGNIFGNVFRGDVTNDKGTSQPLRLYANGPVLFGSDNNNDGTGGFTWYNNGESGANIQMVLTDAGQLGIGTSNPAQQLTVASANGYISMYQNGFVPMLESNRGANYAPRLNMGSGSGITTYQISNDGFATFTDEYVFGTSQSGLTFRSAVDNQKSLGTSTFRWTAVYAVNGTIQTSDAREKENIKSIPYGLAEILKLRPVSYNWRPSYRDNSTKLGLIAQEVLPVMKELVYNPKDTEPELIKDEQGNLVKNPNYVDRYGVNYSELIPVLIKAIQEQQKQIEELKLTVESLLKK